MPILELGITRYSGWHGVIIYPGESVIRKEVTGEDDVMRNVRKETTGEAWEHGPVILSWQDIEPGDALVAPGAQPYNMVVHELAHKLDMFNDGSDGIPTSSSRLYASVDRKQWVDDLYAEYDAFVNHCEQTPERRWGDDLILSVLGPCGAQHPAEFLTVASEVFFVEPVALLEALPSLYVPLQAFYLQGPAQRVLSSEQRQEGSLPWRFAECFARRYSVAA